MARDTGVKHALGYVRYDWRSGTGYVLRGIDHAFEDTELYGTEIFTEGLRFARERVPSARFVQMDGKDMPYR